MIKASVRRRRSDVLLLVNQAMGESLSRNKKIETIDPLVVCARRLFPYQHDEAIYDYARTALRLIRNQSMNQPKFSHQQTTLKMHIPQQ